MTVASDDRFSSASVHSTAVVMFRWIFHWTIATSLWWWHEDVELVVSSRREWRRKIVDPFDRFNVTINFSTRVLKSTDQHEDHESNELQNFSIVFSRLFRLVYLILPELDAMGSSSFQWENITSSEFIFKARHGWFHCSSTSVEHVFKRVVVSTISWVAT